MSPIAALILAAAQQPAPFPSLGIPTAVDVRVNAVMWHPRGEGLLYTREEKTGQGVGFFMPDQKEGTVLFHLGQGDRYAAQWFEGSPNCVVILTHPTGTKQEPKTQILIHIVDAKQANSRVVFNRVFPAEPRPSVNVDTSPTLGHAIFRIKHGKSLHHMILAPNGSSLIDANEIDQAVSQNYDGPTWTLDGTAVYTMSQRGANDPLAKYRDAEVSEQLKSRLGLEKATLAKLPNSTEKKSALAAYTANAESIKWVTTRMAVPKVGQDVLEVMPSTGLMRPIRFRGAFEAPLMVAPLVPQPRMGVLMFGASKGMTNALWLTQKEGDLENGLLVAAEASRGWLSPYNRGVAYLTNGALFVRPMK